ncbi:glycosyltransferase [Fulvivirga sedimenti]|uniref:Glycosyltransferase n=1 Tax=Fulvivirga sedimenti TaxID=2879465 RepID=A0A9X1HM83_9BACT|nr:glycosyltransferase [Fulvivirga sedimenti]MCA6073418.1 glycosyltransferase [Fulvivirga sedimenti]
MAIKILHIIKSLGRGGAETLLPESLKLHNQNKFEFHYVYFLPWKDQMVSSIEENGGKVTCMEANNNIAIMRKRNEVVDYCRNNNIQLIHCHLPWAGFLGRLVHRKTGIPMVYTEHNKQERYHRVTFNINRWTFNSQTAAIAVSEDVRDSIIKNINPSIPVRTILNGVNTVNFQRDRLSGISLRNELGYDEGTVVIGTIAVFRFQKRIVEWLQIFKAVHQRHPEVRGIIVGDGPLKEEILAERKRLELEEVVHMAGLQTEVRPYLSAMDIYLMSSSFEGLPIALLEALSMECAVVTTDAGGIGEIITHNQHGLMASVDQWKTLANYITDLIEDSDKRRIMGSAGRQRIVDAFSMEQMVRNLEGIYQEYASKA